MTDALTFDFLADELATIVWLFNRTADPRLLELARTLKAQGTDWRVHDDAS